MKYFPILSPTVMETPERLSKRAFARKSRPVLAGLLLAGLAFGCAVVRAAPTPLASSVTADHKNSASVPGGASSDYESTTFVATNPDAQSSYRNCAPDFCLTDTAATGTVVASFDSASTFSADLNARGHVSYSFPTADGASASASSYSTYTFTVTSPVAYRLSGFIADNNDEAFTAGTSTISSSFKLSKGSSDLLAVQNGTNQLKFSQNFAKAGFLLPGTYTITASCSASYNANFDSGSNEVKYTLVLSLPTVNSTGDAADANPGDGVCETAAGNGVCTLRAALQEVPPDSTIVFEIPTSDPNYNAGTGAYTITLSNGELPIAKGVTINGPGMNVLIISGNDASRVFNIPVFSSPTVVNMADLTVTHGNAGSAEGGGILMPVPNSYAILNLTRVAITHCTAGSGGGIAGGTMNLDTCSILSNHSTGYLTGHNNGYTDGGGGVSGYGTLTNCTIGAVGQGNTSISDGGGASFEGTITGGSISGNSVTAAADAFGGGLFATHSLTVRGVDFSFNSVTGHYAAGGGAFRDNSSSNLTLTLCRFYGNSVTLVNPENGNEFYFRLTGGTGFFNLDNPEVGPGRGSTVSVTDATNNWWGCDGDPGTGTCQTVKNFNAAGSFAVTDTSPRIDLVITASPSSIDGGGTSTLTADFSKNSNGATINPTVMNGKTVTFGSDSIGSVNPTSGIVANLLATSTYSAGASGGTSTVSAQVDGAPAATTSISVTPNDTDHDGLLDSWELTYWPTLEGHGALDDFDNDGYVELLELGLGLDPTLPNPGGLPPVTNEGGYLTMTISKQPGVTYEVQSAGSLQPDSFSATTTTILINDGTTLKVRDNVLVGTPPARFIRVKVTPAP